MFLKLNNRLQTRRGGILVLAAFSMVALLLITALVIDVGRLYAAKQRAQNVADAAAIAGCAMLDGTTAAEPDATTVATNIATANNDTTTNWKVQGLSITFPTTFTRDDGSTVTVNEGEAIQVDCNLPVEYTFGKVAGLIGGSPGATAIATRSAATSLTYGFTPWCVSDTTLWNPDMTDKLETGTPTTLKITNPQDPANFLGPGNFLAVSFNGDTGGSTYRDRIAGDLPPIELGTGTDVDLTVDAQPGNMQGPTYQGLHDRLLQDNVYNNDSTAYSDWQTDWNAYQDSLTSGGEPEPYPTTPRIVIIPIIADPVDPLNGRKPLSIVGFAAFFIESYSKQDESVTGRFLSGVAVGDSINWEFGDFDAGTTLITQIRLVR